MPARIRQYCQQNGQLEPETVGQILRAIYESLALKYRLVLDDLKLTYDLAVEQVFPEQYCSKDQKSPESRGPGSSQNGLAHDLGKK